MKKIRFLLFISIWTISNQLLAQSNTVYGLNFVGSELRFAALDLTTGAVDILTDSPISSDGFQQGVSDFDPISKSYFYIRGNSPNLYLIRVNALSGELMSEILLDNPNGIVAPITNIAFNWIDDKIYGVSHDYNGTTEILKLVVLDPVTGIIQTINENPVHTGPYLSGNADIDPIHRKYHFVTPNSLVSVDLDTGEANSLSVNFPASNYPQSMINIAYNWLDLQLYGLQFLTIPDPNIFDDDFFTSELRLSKIDLETGAVTVISEEPISNDGFSMGDCDIDPANNRYFYIRQNAIHIVDLTSGAPISIVPIENPNDAIVPVINMGYDDLAATPPTLNMVMDEEIILQPNSSVELNVWVGDDAIYLWNDGNTNPIRSIDEPGIYTVDINRDEFIIQANMMVQLSTPIISPKFDQLVKIEPNIATDYITLSIENIALEQPIEISIIDNNGKIISNGLLQNNIKYIEVSNLKNGLYYIKSNSKDYPFTNKFMVFR